MPDAGAGAQDLNASRFDSALAAKAVSVRYGPFTDISDDFDIGMLLQRKARVWRDLLIVPDAQPQPGDGSSCAARQMCRRAFSQPKSSLGSLSKDLRSIIGALTP